jgi:hypothetical protein
MSRLPTKVGKGAAVWAAAQVIANEIMKLELNRDEAYVESESSIFADMSKREPYTIRIPPIGRNCMAVIL